LRDDRARFEEAGAGVALIGLGRPEQADVFCERRRLPFTCLTSPDRSAHRAYGLLRGSANQVAGPALWAPWLRNLMTGNAQGRFGQGDVAQLPGTFVVDTAGVIRFAHRGRRANDNPSNDEVLAALAALREETG
jgi:peroxiredoxin